MVHVMEVVRFVDRTDYHYLQNSNSVVHRYHPDKLQNQIMECMKIEEFLKYDDMPLRCFRWEGVRNHYMKWMHSQQA